MKKIWIVLIAVFLLLLVTIAAISLRAFSEQQIPAASVYQYENAIRPLEGIIIEAKEGMSSDIPVAVVDWEGREQVVEWNEDDVIEWNLDIAKSGIYELSIGYYPLEGNRQDIEFYLSLDGRQLSERTPFTLNRAWRDAEAGVMKSDGNQLRPKQVEVNMWLETKVQEAFELSGDTLKIELTKGNHHLTLINNREPAMLDYIMLTEVEKSVSYEEYRLDEKQPKIESHDKEIMQLVQAEAPYLKSTAGLFPTVDRSSSYTQPYHPTKIRMNTIGGSNWDIDGQWISWKVEAPESGWYKLGMRYHQNKVKGSFVSRKIIIDNVVPFAEFENVRFLYNTSWKVKELGDEQGEPYLIYLEQGVHELKMEVTLGDLAAPLQILQDIVYDLNQLYRKIVMITGVAPDPFRDYDLDKSVPELMTEFQRLSAGLKQEVDHLDQLSDQKNTTSSTLLMLAKQLDSFVERPESIPKRLDNYKTSISGLADVLLSIRSQPLELDYIYIASPDVKPPKADANAIERVTHELRTFAGSFVQDYDSMGSTETTEGDPLNIWIGLGRDQAYVLDRMIEESFVPETGIQVNLNLVKDALVKAVMADIGPDINLFTSRGDAMNLAIRGALEPMDTFAEFESMSSEYMENAFVPYEYGEHIYAIPDEQLFFMMFYREDVLQDLSLEAPQTWEELMKIAPVLQNNNLQIGLPYESLDAYGLLNQGMGLLNLFPTLLMQNDSGVYNDEHTATRFNEAAAFRSFTQWTNFYNLYDYPLYKNDFNRFWTGEMPIVIANYKLYNTLVGVAPEIEGTWKMVSIPGVKQTDGKINRASAANGTASVILKDAKNKEDAWTFMQWWNDPDVQSQFARELENELGILGRRTPANIESFTATNWSRAEQIVLMAQWQEVQEVPELPGGYYTSRNIDNAFRSVVFEWENPREALFKWNKEINDEITRKRYEFGVKE